ncbi:MAG TPA: Fic family protein [Planctomycetaceae bacterium]
MFDTSLREAGERALLALGELRAIIPSLPNPRLITEPFLRREAVLSSRIEGTHTELEGLYLYEAARSDQPDMTEDEKDAREVSNYVVALHYGIARLQELPICNRLLKEMHERLLANVADDRGRYKGPGKFRQAQAYIGSQDILAARYVAPPPEEVDRLMGELERYVNAESTLPTLIRIALVHYQFEAIHPFADGNGRVGRLLISLMLAATGLLPQPLLYLSAYFERNKTEYVQRMWEISRSGAWEPWLAFFLRGVDVEAQDATGRARSLLALREQYRNRLQSDKAASSLLTLIDRLFEWPVLSVNDARDRLGMSYEGARKNVDKLVEHGILVEVTGNYRNRLYLARPITALMS